MSDELKYLAADIKELWINLRHELNLSGNESEMLLKYKSENRRIPYLVLWYNGNAVIISDAPKKKDDLFLVVTMKEVSLSEMRGEDLLYQAEQSLKAHFLKQEGPPISFEDPKVSVYCLPEDIIVKRLYGWIATLID